jgi:hypothetical protein
VQYSESRSLKITTLLCKYRNLMWDWKIIYYYYQVSAYLLKYFKKIKKTKTRKKKKQNEKKQNITINFILFYII